MFNVDGVPFSQYVVRNPIILVNVVGFMVALGSYWIKSWKDRSVQYRANYLNLELEASRIFTVHLQNPDVSLYLSRDSLADGSGEKDTKLREQALSLICQTLNVFEIAVSLRREKMIPRNLFATWVPWFFELGTLERFEEYWNRSMLRFHYKKDLIRIMDIAINIRRSPSFGKNPQDDLERFHREVARLFKVAGFFSDCTILRQFDEGKPAAA